MPVCSGNILLWQSGPAQILSPLSPTLQGLGLCWYQLTCLQSLVLGLTCNRFFTSTWCLNFPWRVRALLSVSSEYSTIRVVDFIFVSMSAIFTHLYLCCNILSHQILKGIHWWFFSKWSIQYILPPLPPERQKITVLKGRQSVCWHFFFWLQLYTWFKNYFILPICVTQNIVLYWHYEKFSYMF